MKGFTTDLGVLKRISLRLKMTQGFGVQISSNYRRKMIKEVLSYPNNQRTFKIKPRNASLNYQQKYPTHLYQ